MRLPPARHYYYGFSVRWGFRARLPVQGLGYHRPDAFILVLVRVRVSGLNYRVGVTTGKTLLYCFKCVGASGLGPQG